MTLGCIIVEDEPLAAERMKEYIARLPFLNLHGCFDNGIEAMTFLRSTQVDLIFLDINMDGFSGIQLLESVQVNSRVIMTTAYDEYAIKGFELNVTDYLLKPFTFERFVQAINKVQPLKPLAQKEFLFVKTEYRLEKIRIADILYIQGMRDYRKIVTTGASVMTLQTFSDFEEEIAPEIICRVHKSYMVSIAHIDSVERDEIRIRNAEIPISDTYRKQFYALIQRPVK